MELSRIAEVDNAQNNHIEKIKSVKELDNKYKVMEDEQYKKAQGNKDLASKNEVILDNIKFGYNRTSRDFFVKVTRGNSEYKYPTEDMMRIKAHLLRELEEQQN